MSVYHIRPNQTRYMPTSLTIHEAPCINFFTPKIMHHLASEIYLELQYMYAKSKHKTYSDSCITAGLCFAHTSVALHLRST